MSVVPSPAWLAANQRHLVRALGLVRQQLLRQATRLAADEGSPAGPPETAPAGPANPSPPASDDDLQEEHAALELVCKRFALSPFERDVLVLCAGCELDSTFATHCATIQGDPRQSYPTFRLALTVLPKAHWSALAPSSPLRRFRLIEVQAKETLIQSPLRIEERVLHYLTGLSYLDERLQGLVVPGPALQELAPSQQAIAERVAAALANPPADERGPLLQLCGPDEASQRLVAAAACAALGLRLHVLHAAQISTEVAQRETLSNLWAREATLTQSGLLVVYDDGMPSETVRTTLAFCAGLEGVVLLASREPLPASGHSLLRLDVEPPTEAEQYALWQRLLAPMRDSLNGQPAQPPDQPPDQQLNQQLNQQLDQQLERVVGHFRLSLSGMHSACATLKEQLAGSPKGAPPVELATALWDACRALARPQISDLAQLLEPVASWDDLILPEGQLSVLREVALHLRQRQRVYGAWGFGKKGGRGLGISALFCGASGTGKTMAAEVLAAELRLDVYRIDLSQVVSKYIGETEKNLRRVFDGAEQSGAILLFDEADALFGKRSEVKDSHDRHANIEVSYLLQRMEVYRGLAILTSNMKSALDTAFLRRIRFVVQFPFPDYTQRKEIWRRLFPAATPREALDWDRLARLNVAGGNIRNIALSAAFLAADANQPVRMAHILRAARGEYAKLEKTLTDAETSGWT